jgi:serine/threonine-protein kinase RsbW
MILWIRGHLLTLSLNETKVKQTELACEEALVNIIDYGYKELSGDIAGDIEIEITEVDKKIEILIRDRGEPFNPLEQEVGFDPLATLEERKIGGLGILFMRQYVDEIRYEYLDGANSLTLVKRSS